MRRLNEWTEQDVIALSIVFALVAFGLLAGMALASDSDSDPTGACCYEKPRPDGTVIDECSNNRTEAWCDNRQNSTWSEGLSCDEVSCPPIELGSCCFDCLPDSGTEDFCEDEATEAYCDESGGAWLLDTPCSQRDDCSDFCPPFEPTGALCFPELIVTPADGGISSECVSEITLNECEAAYSNCDDWQIGETCESIRCVGAICIAEGFIPDKSIETLFCAGEITLEECGERFGSERCEAFFEPGVSCEAILCRAVPTVPRAGLIALAAILAICGYILARRRLAR